MNRRFILSCLVIVAGLACLVAGLAVAGLVGLPTLAAAQFGPPSPRLTPVQRAYLSGLLLLEANELTLPANPYGEERSFEVPLGASIPQITAQLQADGLVPDAAALRHYLIYSGLDTSLQAGAYRLSPQMTPLEIAHSLQDATPTEVTFNLLPGWRMEEIAAALPTSGLSFSPEAFLAAASSPSPELPFAADLPPSASLEGFLFPDAYQLDRELTAEEFVAVLAARFDAQVTPRMRESYAEHGLSLYQAVTLASIVEREAIVDAEMPLIASVFHNRLRAGMKLDSDPTVQYALGYDAAKDTWWTNPLSLGHLQVDSPYNTYIYTGLPPGPIANPSLEALQAVAFPALSPYYYFRATCDNTGLHTFAETFEEHVNNACP